MNAHKCQTRNGGYGFDGLGYGYGGGYRNLYPYPYPGYPYPRTRRVYPYPWPSLRTASDGHNFFVTSKLFTEYIDILLIVYSRSTDNRVTLRLTQ